MNNTPIIAYIATDNTNCQHLFFAENEHRAGHQPMHSLRISETAIRIKRAPMLDNYLDKIVPAKLLIKYGFELSCIMCEEILANHSDIGVYEGEDVYCSKKCFDGLYEVKARFNL